MRDVQLKTRFPAFYFDGNKWFGGVDSEEAWCELVSAYEGDVQRVLGARNALHADLAALPENYHLDAPAVREGDLETFGFRREHKDGAVTLDEWARARGVDLAALYAARARA